MFTKKDLQQLKLKGITPEIAEKQLLQFKKGFPYANITAAATLKNGIIKLSDKDIKTYETLFDNISKHEKIVKFVPASGAASRMFKNLFAVLNGESNVKESPDFNSAYTFFQNIEKFAFYDDLKTACNSVKDFKTEYKKVLSCLLTEEGLNYGNLPKGLLKFHTYENESRTPVQEHLTEGALYAKSGKNVYIHFTVSPEHLSLFRKHVDQTKTEYEKRFDVKFEINYSIQKPSTDTIAVDLQNRPFRNADGSLLFRPGGHGALIEDLNDIEADLIFLKNIDNVVPDELKDDTVNYKKALAGLLKEKQKQIFEYIRKLQNDASENFIKEVKDFLQTELFISPDKKFEAKNNTEKVKYLINKLNRPFRVCGMVKNEDEPGGGPFFVQKESGSVSLQIVESAQIDMQNPGKAEIVKNATHFNPVDLVLGIKDYKGNKFDLRKFVDPETGFISQKSKDGKELKALELPGLWNGAMADWNTLFVEVPISTFNPVKTVNDLLRETHQKTINKG